MDVLYLLVAVLLFVGGWFVLFKIATALYARIFKPSAKNETSKYERPSILTKEQRKGLTDILGPVKSQTKSSRPSAVKVKPMPNRSTRAIKQGWSIGEVRFSYEDANGIPSERHVIVHSVSGTYIKGECLDRQAERTFRLDRINGDVVDCNTGELIDPFDLGDALEY